MAGILSYNRIKRRTSVKGTVYLGANMGDNPSFKEATIALGRWIAKNGLILVYGGSKMGLMGVLGDTVLEYGD